MWRGEESMEMLLKQWWWGWENVVAVVLLCGKRVEVREIGSNGDIIKWFYLRRLIVIGDSFNEKMKIVFLLLFFGCGGNFAILPPPQLRENKRLIRLRTNALLSEFIQASLKLCLSLYWLYDIGQISPFFSLIQKSSITHLNPPFNHHWIHPRAETYI